jgi:hypothetical protein
MNAINIYPCGTKATTKMGSLAGMITCIQLRFNNVCYELSYFHNGEMKTCWVYEPELDFNNDSGKIEIGFKKNKE